jgi:hypothetical protein
MDNEIEQGLSAEELGAEGATALPDKEVVSILDLNADIDLAIDAAAPIDLAVAANANVAAPIDAAVSANVLSSDSTAQALSDQGVMITQGIDADATATAEQDSAIDQGNDTIDDGTPAEGTPTDGAAPAATTLDPTAPVGETVDGVVDGATGTAGDVTGGATDGLGGATDGVGGAVDDLGGAVDGAAGGLEAGALSGDLLNVDVNVDADTDIAAPVNGAVAANANVAAPIDASVAANIGSEGSDAVAVSQQDAIIDQQVTGSAEATSDQSSDIEQ